MSELGKEKVLNAKSPKEQSDGSTAEIIKLGLLLCVITAICAGLLGAANSITAPIIAERKEDSKQAAMKEILKEAESFQTIKEVEDENVKELYVGVQNNSYVGAVVKVAPAGYGGPLELLIGVDKEGKIKGVKLLVHTETPGLGANASSPSFIDQFKDKIAPLKVTKGTAGEDEIEAITGATITSDGVTKGVNLAAEYITTHQQQLEQEVGK